MNEYKKKKSGNYKIRRPIYKPPRLGGLRGGARRWMPPTYPLRRTYDYKTEPKQLPKEKSHWNGKVEVWTEPQKPRHEKIVKYEVNTDQLLNDLARENKETIDGIIERLGGSKAEPSHEQSEEDNLQKTDSSEITETSATTEPKEEKEQAEATEENAEAEPQPESDSEQQEASHETGPEAEVQENPLDAPELIYMSPSFWENLESELSNELEQMEPQEDLEISEEGEPDEEGY